MMAGYSGTPLPRKLGLKENQRIAFINPPDNFEALVGPIPPTTLLLKKLTAPIDLAVLFVDQEKVLAKEFPKIAKKLSPNGMIWVAWPKKTSGVTTDLMFERVQRIGLEVGLVDVKICAIDEVWSGLKFVIRLEDRKK